MPLSRWRKARADAGPRRAERRRDGTRIVADPSRAKVEVRNLEKIYFDEESGRRVHAISGLDLDIYPNEFVCIVGRSGCGKSTLLRIMAGLDKATSGTLLQDGIPVKGPSVERGMVFQDFALLPWKTVRQNIEFGPKLGRVPRGTRQDIVEHYIDLVGLRGFEEHFPSSLSGGMRQRVSVARSLANGPGVLLMDEPFASVDALTRQTLQQELTRVWASESTTVVFVTHSVEEALFLGDRVIVLAGSPSKVKIDVRVDASRPRERLPFEQLAEVQEQKERILAVIGGANDEDDA